MVEALTVTSILGLVGHFNLKTFSNEEGRKSISCVSVWGAVQVACYHLSPTCWLIAMV